MFAGSAKPDDQTAVLAAEKQLATAMIKADVAALDKLLADDLSYTHSAAKTETKADLLQTAKTGSTKYESITYDNTAVREYGNTVVTTHKMTIVAGGNTNKLYVSFVWVKMPAGWQLVSRQATKLP
jgi:Domain of unknown function (DUF4440)